jgi:hypothetical protein
MKTGAKVGLAERVAANWWESGERVFEFKEKGKPEKEWKGTYKELLALKLPPEVQVFAKGPGHGQWTHVSRQHVTASLDPLAERVAARYLLARDASSTSR